MTTPTFATLSAPRGGLSLPSGGRAGGSDDDPHVRYALCPPRGPQPPFGRPGGRLI
jgi:hypothetical protein